MGEVGTDVNPCPAVVLDVAVLGLCTRCDRHAAQDARVWVASSVGLFYTKSVLN